MKRTWTIALILLLAVGGMLYGGLRWSGPVWESPPGSDLMSEGTPTRVRAAITAGAGSLTVVNFWASWCEPCKREFPYFTKLARQYRDRGVRLLFISVDDKSDFAEAETFLRENGVDFHTFYKGTQSLNFVAELFPKWTGAVPATVLFGPNAEILDAWEGETTWPALEKKVLSKLAKP
jgi:thiol-disulfide isomerase/thioredoxin